MNNNVNIIKLLKTNELLFYRSTVFDSVNQQV